MWQPMLNLLNSESGLAELEEEGGHSLPDFLRFNEVRVDHGLKTIKIFIAAPIFVPSAGTVNDNWHNGFVGPYIFSGAFEA